MIPVPLDAFLSALRVPLRSGWLTSAAVDHREVRSGGAFFGLKGRRTDGSDFIPAALEAGASVAVGRFSPVQDPRVVVLNDPVVGLVELARQVRSRFLGPVIGITGSVGKTSVKEFLGAFLAADRATVFPQGSFNNREGVSRTVCALELNTQVLVSELGTSAPGEIRDLCAISNPTLGVITAIGPSHLEGLGSVEGVLEEKLDLARSLPAGATLFVNGDDEVLRTADYPRHLRVLRVGLEDRAGHVSPPPSAGRWDSDWDRHFGTEVLRRNGWIAAQVALHLGVSPAVIERALPTLRPPRWRGEVLDRGITRIHVDCYNANPLSMSAALKELASAPGPRRAVLGDMLELGPASRELHGELGQELARLGFEEVLLVGSEIRAAEEGYHQAGGRPERLSRVDTVGDARGRFEAMVRAGGTLLLKGSRGIGLERLLATETAGE